MKSLPELNRETVERLPVTKLEKALSEISVDDRGHRIVFLFATGHRFGAAMNPDGEIRAWVALPMSSEIAYLQDWRDVADLEGWS